MVFVLPPALGQYLIRAFRSASQTPSWASKPAPQPFIFSDPPHHLASRKTDFPSRYVVLYGCF